MITNNWLFGAVGNDNPAEVWEKAGSTFTCSKELFDFNSLLNDTKTAAVIAVPGGAVLGTAIGAAAGAGAYKKKHDAYLESDPCADENYVKELGAKIYDSGQGATLKSFAYKNVTFKDGEYKGDPIFDEDANFNTMTEAQCRDLHALDEKVGLYESLINECLANSKNVEIADAMRASIADNSHRTMLKTSTLTNSNGSISVTEIINCNKPQNVTQEDLPVFDSQCKFVPLRSNETGVLCTKDKECIVTNIRQFVEQNKAYDKSDEDNLSPLEREHIIERFNEIADDIVGLDENEYPYFVFKNTSVDDNVEFWFRSFDEEVGEYADKSIKDWDKFLAEFVVIEDGKITKFISNLDYQYE